MPAAPRLKITSRTAAACRKLVMKTARKYKIPPVYITAHIRSSAADAARREVWRIMIDEMGLRRHQVATMFGRDLRRVRASVLAG